VLLEYFGRIFELSGYVLNDGDYDEVHPYLVDLVAYVLLNASAALLFALALRLL